MNEQEFIKKLKRLQTIKPRTEWLERNRALLLSGLKESGDERGQSELELNRTVSSSWDVTISLLHSLLPSRRTVVLLRPAGVFAVLSIFLLISSIVTVSASQETIPGDTLYPVKIVSEKVQRVLTTDESEKAKLEISFAGKRIDELEKIISQPVSETIKVEQVETVLDKFEENITSAQETLDVLSVDSDAPEEAVSLAEVIDEKVSEYKETLDKTAEAASPDVKEAVEDAAEVAEDHSDAALSVIVEKHDAGEVVKSQEEISEKVDEKIASLSEEIDEVERQIDMLLSATTTEDMFSEDESEIDLTTTTEKLLVTKEQIGLANKILDEAKELVEEEMLSEALAKVSESKVLIDAAKKRVENIANELGIIDEAASTEEEDTLEPSVEGISTSTIELEEGEDTEIEKEEEESAEEKNTEEENIEEEFVEEQSEE